jgi:transposase-like protein
MSRSALSKRQGEVLERLEAGYSVRKIATDIGVTRSAVYQIIDRLRREGVVPDEFTPSGRPPRLRRGAAEVAAAPSGSRLAELRELSRRSGSGRAYADVLAAAVAEDDVLALAYELGRLDAGGVPEVVESGQLAETTLRRMRLIEPNGDSRGRRRGRA